MKRWTPPSTGKASEVPESSESLVHAPWEAQFEGKSTTTAVGLAKSVLEVAVFDRPGRVGERL